MTDLDAFRAALQTPPSEDLGTLDIGQIMAVGGRIRRRRRLTGVAMAAAVVLVLLATAVGVGSAVGIRHSQLAAAGNNPPSLAATADPNLLGWVVSTGIREAAGELVFYLEKFDAATPAPVDFGIVAGLRTSSGALHPGIINNDVDGAADAPGFHAVHGPIASNGVSAPEFGYYVGPATKITGRVAGHTVTTRQGTASRDPRVVVFWFAPDDTRTGHEPTDLTAYDAAGQVLPTGDHSEPSHG